MKTQTFNITVGKGASLVKRPLPPLMLGTGCHKFYICQHKESSDGGVENEGEDAVRKKIRQESWLQIPGSTVTAVMTSFAPA